MRVLIVDDEPLARERIRDLLAGDADVDAIAQCRNGLEAAIAIRGQAFDLVFLDVQMPGRDGFGMLEDLDDEGLPLVIFVTAYEQYALRAFEVHAVDYLLKPFDRERFTTALRRAKERLASPTPSDFRRQLRGLLDELRADVCYPERLAVKKDGRILSVKIEDIDWIEAEGNYVKLHIGRTAHLHREKLAALEARLDPRRFRRIHRSTIVNVERIKEFVPWFRKDFRVHLRDGTELTLSRSYKDRVQELLGSSE